MTRVLPPPPIPEPPPSNDLMLLAPLMAEKAWRVVADMKSRGHDAIVFEAFRSDARADWLYRLGREFDDGKGRGIVTNAPNARKTWHRYGLAVDIVSASRGWDMSPRFRTDLRTIATSLALTSGADWNRNGIPVEEDPAEHLADHPHIQWWCPGMHVTPSDHAWELLQTKGIEAVWAEVHAVFIPPPR